MINAQVQGLIRTLLAAGAGYFVGKGMLDQGTADQIVGGLTVLSVAGWSIYSKRKA